MASRRMHPIVEGAARAVAQIGGKAIRRAVDSVMEDGQRAAEDLQRDIMNMRTHTADPIDVPFEVRQVPTEEEEMERARRARRQPAGRDDERETRGDPPEDLSPEDMQELRELTDLRDAETLLRHGWMLLADLSDQGVYPKENAGELEELLDDLRDRIEDREGT